MDTFIDKLAQKRNAQEMIKANMTAEALKMEQLQTQMQAYDMLMQEIRQVNLKTAENVAEVQGVLRECIAKLDAMQTGGGQEQESGQDLAQIRELLEEKFEQSDDFLHRENIKVYRNVQAAVVEELNKQTQTLQESLADLNSRLTQKNNGTGKAALAVSILVLLGVLADIALHLAPMFGITF